MESDGSYSFCRMRHSSSTANGPSSRSRRRSTRTPAGSYTQGVPLRDAYQPCRAQADLPVLLDGELMNPEGTHALYLAYDCMNLGARRLTDAPFSERIAAFEKVAERYRTAVPDDDLSAHDHPFRIASKFFVPQVEIVRILHKIHPHMGSYRFVDLKRRRVNKNDGLIFVADVDKYRPEKPTTLMKWKWPDKNSVDFIVRAPFFNDRGELELRCGS